MANQTVSDLLGAIERIGPLIAEHPAANEADRRLSDAVYHAMYDAGLYGMLAPKAFGGLELHPADCLRSWEAVARIVLRRQGSAS
jgi:alkylation response protein AidB-like acyl-CoA dehydrogenase